MVNPDGSRNDTREFKRKYIHLKMLYCKLLAAQKHVEEKLKLAQEELSLDIDEQQGTDELIAALKTQVQELRKINSTKDKFISIIAHDLKGPFNSIINASRILHDVIHAKRFDDAEKISEIILHSSSTALDLLKDLMEWALMQTGNMELKPEKKNFSEIVDHVMPLFTEKIKEKGITVEKNVPADVTVFADFEMIGVVVRNLVSNALKFTHEGGRVEITAEQKPGETIVSVSDTGIGIPENKLQELFCMDKSYRRGGTKKEGGTGLGLIICKDIVKNHGGNIWAESREDKGSTFCFSVPK